MNIDQTFSSPPLRYVNFNQDKRYIVQEEHFHLKVAWVWELSAASVSTIATLLESAMKEVIPIMD